MANGPEKNLTEFLKRIPDWDIQRIEVVTAQGIPDCNIAIKGRPGNIWVELKALKYIKMRAEQYAWGLRRTHYYDDTVYLMNGYDKILKIWKFPFIIEPAGKGHVKPVSDPMYEMSYDYFREEFNRKMLWTQNK